MKLFIPALYRAIDMSEASFDVLGSSEHSSLNNMHTNTGYNNHSNSGYSNHANTGYNNHSNTGANNHSNSGANNHANTGYNNHTNTGYNNWYNYGNGHYNTWKEYFNYHPGWTNNGGHSANSHSNGGYNNWSNSGYNNWSNSGYNNWSNSGYSNHTNTGYSNHTNTGANGHTNTGANNHVNTGYSNHTNYSNNYSPIITGSVLPASGTFNQSITLDWRGCTIVHANVPGSTAGTDSGTNAVSSYKVYYRTKGNGTVWGKWTYLSQPTAQTLVVNTASWTAGVWQFAVTAHDGIEESAIFNSTEGTFSPAAPGISAPQTTPSVLYSGELTISHYSAPEWANIVRPTDRFFRAYDINEVHSEIKRAAEAFGLSVPSSFRTITVGVDRATKADLQKLQTDGSAVYKGVKGTDYVYALPYASVTIDKTTKLGREVLDLREILERIS